jgi:hypothetical protein
MTALFDLAFALASYDPLTRTAVVDIVASAESSQRIVSADIGFRWDEREMTLISFTDERTTIPFLLVGIPQMPWDFYGLNEADPPADGNGWVMWLSPLNGIPVIEEKAIIGSLVFTVHAEKTTLSFIDRVRVDYPFRTVVYGTDTPGLDITGELSSLVIRRDRDAR